MSAPLRPVRATSRGSLRDSLRPAWSRWLAHGERFWDRIVGRKAAARRPRTLAMETLEDRVVPAGGLGRPLPDPVLFAGSGPGEEPIVRAFNADTGKANYTVAVFESSFTGGVHVASADLNADQYPDFVVGAGAGGGPRVRVFDGRTGVQFETPIGSFWAYESEFTGGVVVAAGDVTGDGRPDLVTAAASGGGPRVRVFDGVTGESVADFWAFDESFTGGLNIAVGDLTIDGHAEVLVGAGSGGGPRVRAFDLAGAEPNIATGYPHTDFFADDPELRDGVAVAVGDVNGDFIPDVITAPAMGGTPRVKVFNGFDGSTMSDFLAFGAGHTAGLRVAGFYLTDDPYADIVVSSDAEGEGRVRVFRAGTGQLVAGPMADFVPLDEGFDGVRIAAANDPGTNPVFLSVSSDPSSIVSGQAFKVRGLVTDKTQPPIEDDPPPPPPPPVVPTGTVTFYLQQSSPSTGNTMTLGQDTLVPEGYPLSSVDTAEGFVTVSDLALDAGSYSLWFTYSGDSYFASATSSKTTITVSASPIPPLSPRTDYVSNPILDDVYPAGSGLNVLPTLSRGGVRVHDGTITIARTDFAASFAGDSGLLQGWNWTNAPGYPGQESGDGGSPIGLPRVEQLNSNLSLGIMAGHSSMVTFDLIAGAYRPRYNAQASLIIGSAEITFTDGRGNDWVFYDFSVGNPSARRGRLKSMTTTDGTLFEVVDWDGSDRPEELQRVTGTGGTAVTESVLFTYEASGANAGLVESVTLRRKVGTGSWETIRVAEYSYYVDADTNGGDTQLKLAVVKDGSSNVIDTSYYRYYSSDSLFLKFAFGKEAYQRLVTDLGTSVDSLSDAQVDDYADHYLEFDVSDRVATHVAAGAGCSICSGGHGEYTYEYDANTIQGGSNVWKNKMTETLPDGNEYVYYTNAAGQVMLEVHEDTTTNAKWRTYQRFDAIGRAIYTAGPSNVTGHDEQYADLVNDQGGNAQYLDDDDGLVHVHYYADATTATTSTAGDVTGFLFRTAIRHGETGSDVRQSQMTYILRDDGTYEYAFPASATQYRNTDATGGQTTSWAYTWQSGTAQAESITTTLPTVTTAQNGPNAATSSVVFNDEYGRPIWTKDADGFLGYVEYDTKTGAVTKTIADVEDANTTDFTGLPSGWTTPATGGLHLITTYEVDHLGRTTKATMPNGRVDYTVYDDDNFEVRYYPGWISGSNVPTGPITVVREDRAAGYVETLTMSATPSVSGNRPTGSESIASLESLSRSYRNKAGQVTHTDSYFNLSGVTYSTAANIGTLNTNYYRTTTDYGKQGGQPNRQVSAAGTITRTEYDSLGRAVSIWVGTDDTPTSGPWSVSNLTGTNMTKVAEYEYDGGGVGDGNLTEVTQIPGGGAADRVTQTFYDWRNRPVAVKSGVEGSESTSVNRPIQYVDYDNLNQVVTTRLFDGDTVSISSTADVPDAPSSSLLRAKSTTSYDELGRAYKSEVYSVDPSNGSVGGYTLATNTWFDNRGNVVKSSSPGGLVQKVAYDGVGRTTVRSATDGGGDSGYSDADDVTGDKVLSQDEYAYDASGLVLVATHRDRFHDATDTGALGNPSSTSGTAKARVSYVGHYYDAGDRVTATVDVGSNGGSAWSRPGSVPSRSDTVLVASVTYDSAGLTSETTDPKAIVARTLYDDLGRTTKTIEHYVDGTVGDDNDKTTEYTYGPAGMTSLTAKLTGGGGQTTEWVYGVSSGITSNDIVGETRWPDASTGSASSSEDEDVTVNALGETITREDRNGNVHTFGYDVLGRMVDDVVTTLGTNVDGAVRRIRTAYDGQGNPYLLTSHDATTGGNIVNEVQRAYNGLGQLITEWQSHSGAVNTSTSPKVQYAYSEMPSGANHSRLTGMTYPNSRSITFNYSSGLNADISRLTSISDGGTTLESYDYLGLGTVVVRSHPQPGVSLTYIGSPADAGDQYAGLDRFGRIVDQNWNKSGTAVDRYQYAYDRNGNRTSRTNVLNSLFNEVYTYDGLNQIITFNRNSGARTLAWDYDALGNMESVTTNGGSPATRTHNEQNELTVMAGNSLAFDPNGNMTTDETGKQFVYDGWNRVVEVKASGGVTLIEYQYDARNYRVIEDDGTAKHLYYSSEWQLLEERVSGNATASYVWSPIYIDAMIARDRDSDANGSLDERLYPTHDANFNITGLLSTSGSIVERNAYDPFGAGTILNASWSSIGSSVYSWAHQHQGLRLVGVSGAHHVRHREYSATQGRWGRMDPLGYGAGDVDLYRFVYNQPLGGTDPSGLFFDPATATIGISIISLDFLIQAGIIAGLGALIVNAAANPPAGGPAMPSRMFPLEGNYPVNPNTGNPYIYDIISGLFGPSTRNSQQAADTALVPVGSSWMAPIFEQIGLEVQKAAIAAAGGKPPNTPPTNVAPSPGEDPNRDPAQDKLLSEGEIRKLKDAGHDIHDLKGKKNSSKRDLYKDSKGNIYVKPKGGNGPGDPTGININDP